MSKLMLRKELYSRATINQACEDYKQIASIVIKDNGEYFLAVFYNCKYPEQLTLDEFENYLIDLTGKKWYS